MKEVVNNKFSIAPKYENVPETLMILAIDHPSLLESNCHVRMDIRSDKLDYLKKVHPNIFENYIKAKHL